MGESEKEIEEREKKVEICTGTIINLSKMGIAIAGIVYSLN